MRFAAAAVLLLLQHAVQECSAYVLANTTTVTAAPATTTPAKPKGTSTSATATNTGISPAMASALADMLAGRGAGASGSNNAGGLVGALGALLGKTSGARPGAPRAPAAQLGGFGGLSNAQPAWASPPYYQPYNGKPPAYAFFDGNVSGSGPKEAYECWESFNNWRNVSLEFQKANKKANYTTWTESFSVMQTIFHNSSQRSYTKLCDQRTRELGGDLNTVVELSFEATRTVSSQTFPVVTAPACTVKDPVCADLFKAYDKSTFSFLRSTLLDFFTKANAGDDMPNVEFAHLQPPCDRRDKCPPESDIQWCKLHAERATVFFWPPATGAPGSPVTVRDACARNPLVVPTPAIEEGAPPRTATFKSYTVTSPTPLVIIKSLRVQVFKTDQYTSVYSYLGAMNPRQGYDQIIQQYYRGCGDVLDATLQLPPQSYSSYRSQFTPSMVYPGRGTSIAAVTLYATGSAAYPLDFADLYPRENVPWDAYAGKVGCNTELWAQQKSIASSRSKAGLTKNVTLTIPGRSPTPRVPEPFGSATLAVIQPAQSQVPPSPLPSVAASQPASTLHPASTVQPASTPSGSAKPALSASSKINAVIGDVPAAETLGVDGQGRAADGSVLERRNASPQPQEDMPNADDYTPYPPDTDDPNYSMLPIDAQTVPDIPIPSPPPGPVGGALKAPPSPSYQAITVLGDTFAADQAARQPAGNCAETFVPNDYQPILQLPTEVAKLNKDYELCQVGRADHAVFHPIIGTQIKLPERTKWGVRVPPLPKTSTVQMESILRWMRPEIAEETGAPSITVNGRTAVATIMTVAE